MQTKNADTIKLVHRFVRLVITINDTPTLIRQVAEHKQFIRYCSVAINEGKNTDLEDLRLYRDLKQETYRQGFSMDKLKEKLKTIADAIGLRVQTVRSIHGDYYQILGVSENAGAETIKKAFRAKARETHPDTASGGNDRFPDVLEAYKNLSDPSLRRSYNLSQKQEGQRQWSEDPRKHKDDTLKKPMVPKYGVHLALILFLLVGTAMIADFVTQQLALMDSPQKVVKVNNSLPENQTGHQHSEPDIEEQPAAINEDKPLTEEQWISKADKPTNKLEEIQTNGIVPESQNIQSATGKEVLKESPGKQNVKEDQNGHEHSESNIEEQPVAINANKPLTEEQWISKADKPVHKNVASDESLKIKVKKFEKQPDEYYSPDLKIEKANNKDSGLDKVSDPPAPSVLINFPQSTGKDDSGLAITPISELPDLKSVNKTGDTASETVVLKETSQINNELEQFLSNYCQAYESRDLTKLMAFFTENAMENGTPLNQLLPKYSKNFQNLASIHYRINMVNYIVDPESGRIQVNGQFFLRWRKNQDKQWYHYNGSIRMDLVSIDESFINNSFSIRELSYRFID